MFYSLVSLKTKTETIHRFGKLVSGEQICSVCAAAGAVGPERSERDHFSQQPAEWSSSYSCTVLGVLLEGLHVHGCYHATRQVGGREK